MVNGLTITQASYLVQGGIVAQIVMNLVATSIILSTDVINLSVSLRFPFDCPWYRSDDTFPSA